MYTQAPTSVFEDIGGGDLAPAPVAAAVSLVPVIDEVQEHPLSSPIAFTSAISAGGITINLQYTSAAMAAPAAFRAAVEQAAMLLANAILDPITVSISIDFTGIGGGAFGGPTNGLFETYTSVAAALVSDVTPGDGVFDFLPTGSSVQGQTNVAVWNTQLKLLGFSSTGSTDGTASFATDINPNALVGVALHELTHAMGRIPFSPQPGVFDLFRFTAAGTWLFDGGVPASSSSYFSLTAGATKLADYGVNSDPSDFLNSGVQGSTDPFNEFYTPGSTLQTLTKVDLKQLDALGFHVVFPDAAPTGSVTITGTATKGQTLTASNNLADADGLGTITYQWRADGNDIAGATGTTLLLGDAQVGKVITVAAKYTDGFATHESVASNGTSAVLSGVNTPPTGGVTISGTPTQGQTLTANNTLADADGLGTLTYQWKADGNDIGTASSNNTLLLGQGQVGKVITVVASYMDGGGHPETVGSTGTSMVANVNDPPTGAVTITGTATAGQTLTASNSLADLDGLGAITYQWQADGDPIGGETGNTLLLGAGQVGKVITVVASYMDDFGANETVTSAGTSAVLDFNTPPTGVVAITGTIAQGQQIAADTSAVADADGIGTFSYQWLRDGNPINLATSVSYTLAQIDVGTQVSVRVTYTDSGGHDETLTSDPTASVVNVNDLPSGAVTISGTPISGQTLTANAGSVADGDGLGAFTYQWYAGGNAIGGANASTFKLTPVQAGMTITVSVSYTDGFNAHESVTSAATAVVTVPPGINVTGTSASETINGADGNDSLNGAAGNDTITAAWGNDTLVGGTGLDALDGQEGSDLYVVALAADHPAAEITDSGTTGADELRYTATATGTLTLFAGDTGIDKVVIGTGTAANAVRTATTALSVNAAAVGNALAIFGNAGVNTITGTAFNDTLDGGVGADKLLGGDGNDLYIVDNARDLVTEASVSGGTDTVQASVTFILGLNIENLALTGIAAINGTGNTLANTITGNAALNLIDGKAGLDVLDGAGGGDIYVVGAAADHPAAEIADTGSSGIDEVRFAATVAGTLTLFAGDTGIEKVTIGTGTAAAATTSGTVALNVDASAIANGLSILGNAGNNVITGTAFADSIDGGAGKDTISGGDGNDTLMGRAGNDMLTGGNGTDAFVFNVAASASSNFDTITDFTGGVDTLQFSKAIFKGLGTLVTPLSSAQFWSGAGAVKGHDADDRLIYDTNTGILYYDLDGSGRGAAIAVAVLGTTTHPDLLFSDILIVS
ncbi:MAG TPA: NF038122 family metalloprotease [Ramlibacter sp.]|nr:NF038122 family metalloprotease [Ramlibacter sp.]